MFKRFITLMLACLMGTMVFSSVHLPVAALADDNQTLAGVWEGSYDISGKGLILTIRLAFSSNGNIEIVEGLLGEQYTQQGKYSADSGVLRMSGAHIEWVYDADEAEYSYNIEGDTLHLKVTEVDLVLTRTGNSDNIQENQQADEPPTNDTHTLNAGRQHESEAAGDPFTTDVPAAFKNYFQQNYSAVTCAVYAADLTHDGTLEMIVVDFNGYWMLLDNEDLYEKGYDGRYLYGLPNLIVITVVDEKDGEFFVLDQIVGTSFSLEDFSPCYYLATVNGESYLYIQDIGTSCGERDVSITLLCYPNEQRQEFSDIYESFVDTETEEDVRSYRTLQDDHVVDFDNAASTAEAKVGLTITRMIASQDIITFPSYGISLQGS